MNKSIKIITVSLLSTSFALGVQLPNSSTINKEIKVPKNIQKNEKGLIELDGLKKPLPPMVDDKSGKTIFVKDFTFEGNTKLSNEYLDSLLNKYKNKDLTFSDLKNVATLITKAYRDKGYFVARAYIPVQDMKNGIITIAIIEGTFGKLHLKNQSRVKDSIVQNILDEAKKDPIISSSSLERAMLIANDTPGIVISKADVQPGEAVGSSDFDIETLPTKVYNGYIIADNHGSRYTGKNRVMAGGNINSPFKIGDKLSLLGMASTGSNLKYGNIAYESLLYPNGLKGGVGYSYTKYKLIKEYENLDASGTSKILNLHLSYPIIRQRDMSLYTNLEFDNKKLKDTVGATNTESKKKINVATLGLKYDLNTLLYQFPSTFNIKANYTYGNLTFQDDTSYSNDAAGANTNGNYSKVYFQLLHVLSLTSKLSFETKLTYQHSLAHKNLDGSEDLSIGEVDGVKVYPTGEESAENGYIASFEPKYLLPSFFNIANTVGVFYDRAKVYMTDSSNVISDSKSYQDMGLSYYLTYKEFFVNSYMAWKLNSPDITSEPDYNSKFLVQAGWVF